MRCGRRRPGDRGCGYDPCWNTQTLSIDLGRAPPSRAPGFELERVETQAQLEELNALAPDFPSYAASLGHPAFFDLLGRRDGRAVAKGQLVFAAPRAAYVADMFTAPAARKAGYAGALLSALHDEARARCAARAVLIPSLAAAEAGFYEKRGYRRVSLDAVLL
jgi:GNAT superfamily N-acetyltransferase